MFKRCSVMFKMFSIHVSKIHRCNNSAEIGQLFKNLNYYPKMTPEFCDDMINIFFEIKLMPAKSLKTSQSFKLSSFVVSSFLEVSFFSKFYLLKHRNLVGFVLTYDLGKLLKNLSPKNTFRNS